MSKHRRLGEDASQKDIVRTSQPLLEQIQIVGNFETG